MMVTMNVSYQQVAGYQEITWIYVLAFRTQCGIYMGS